MRRNLRGFLFIIQLLFISTLLREEDEIIMNYETKVRQSQLIN